MRFSLCLRLVQSVGFFWGTKFILYTKPFLGFKGSVGFRKKWRWFVFSLLDGSFLNNIRKKNNISKQHLQSVGHVLLFFSTPHIVITYPWAWFILKQLKLRTYRAIRYRLGLPSRGQRTHSNAQTVSRHKDQTVSILKNTLWRYRLWQTRSNTKSDDVKKNNKNSKSKQKNLKKKGPVVRSKDKKKSVWR